MQYVPAMSLTLGKSSHFSPIGSRFITLDRPDSNHVSFFYSSAHSAQKQGLFPPPSVTEDVPSLFFRTDLSGIPAARLNQGPPPLSNLLLPQSVEDGESGQVVVFQRSFASMQGSCSSPQSPPPRSLQSTSPNLLHDLEALAEYRLQNDTTSGSDNSLHSTQMNTDKPLRGNAQGQGDRHATSNESDSVESTSCTPYVSQYTAEDVDNDHLDERVPDDHAFSSDDSDKGPAIQTSKSKASTKRRRASSPVSPRKLGSKENPIDADKVASLFEPILIREYV